MALEEIYNYLELSERIATAGQPDESGIRSIAGAGFEVIINLGQSDAPYAIDNEGALVQDLGISYIHIPVEWENPQLADLECFIAVMDDNQDKKIFVHCAANMRVSVFMALYRIIRQGWSKARAMRAVHHIWVPNQVWSAFIDQSLEQLVHQADS